jgi:DNA-binding IclR family transcriptional regulator
MAERTKGGFGIQSIEVGARVLRALLEAGRPLPLRDLARLAGMQPGKAHRYLVSYVRTELAVQDQNTGFYGIGPLAISLGLTALRSVDVVRIAAEGLPALLEATRETALLAIWTRAGPVIYLLEESDRPLYMNVRVGSILPVTRSAAGHVFAAFLPVARSRDLIRAEKARERRKGAGPRMEKILAEVRRRGVAVVAGDLVPGVAAVAAPVLDHKGAIVAAVVTLGPVEEMAVGEGSVITRAVKSCAAEMSRRLGYDAKSVP